jgi:malate dehydrogenase
MTRLSIIGVGRIGGEVAYLTALQKLVDEIFLYDISSSLLKSQILDLQHADLDVTITTEIKDFYTSDVCVFSAGMPRNPSVKTRADLLFANLPAVTQWGRYLKKFEGNLITVTNPMDINNYILWKYSELEKNRCIGFGGQLDSARFGIELKNIDISEPAWVLGEHGEHQVPFFSSFSQNVPSDIREKILANLRSSSMQVIHGKAGTVFGPVRHIASLVDAIVADKREILPCSCILDGEYGICDCSLGVPAKLGREGIISIIEKPLDEWERGHLSEAGEFAQSLCKNELVVR